MSANLSVIPAHLLCAELVRRGVERATWEGDRRIAPTDSQQFGIDAVRALANVLYPPNTGRGAGQSTARRMMAAAILSDDPSFKHYAEDL